jgi:hypothetical protein
VCILLWRDTFYVKRTSLIRISNKFQIQMHPWRMWWLRFEPYKQQVPNSNASLAYVMIENWAVQTERIQDRRQPVSRYLFDSLKNKYCMIKYNFFLLKYFIYLNRTSLINHFWLRPCVQTNQPSCIAKL